MNKLLLEGTPSESMIVFGWLIDTRQMLLWLPQDNFERWVKDLRDLIVHPKISRPALESLVLKLVHAAYIIPLSCHFLSGFWDCLASMNEKNIKHRL